MTDAALEHLIASIVKAHDLKEKKATGEVITVSETVSVAASVYETLRNTLEYDEEHLLRRNAIRRILNRRMDEVASERLAGDLLRELIWARYIPNKRVPESMIDTVAAILEKYRPLFAALQGDSESGQRYYRWLLDMLSTELEYALVPPLSDEALASFAYQKLKDRMVWSGPAIAEADRDLQLYIAVHRAVLKSNIATLRYRIFTLYYPTWTKADGVQIAGQIANQFATIVESIETHLSHSASDHMYRLVRRHAVVFHLVRDIAEDDPAAFLEALEAHEAEKIDSAVGKAANVRYKRFGSRLRRSVARAVVFLFLTKMILALLVEFPYEQLVLQSTNYVPLLVNIIVHPFLLGFIGLTVNIPAKKNTQKIVEEVHGLLGLGKDFQVIFRLRRPWATGALGTVFRTLYALVFLVTIGLISFFLQIAHFNVVSIVLFLFFLSLVTFLGLKIRSTARDLVILEAGGGFFGTISDILFLPIVRTGRWIAMRAPRVNIFLFFFDFIVEAPFKGTIRMIEGWLAFLREKREEI